MMRSVILLSSLFLSSSTFAVVTKKCPKALHFEVKDFLKRNYNEAKSFANSLDYADFTSLESFFNHTPSIQQTVVLESTEYSTCRYTGVTANTGRETPAFVELRIAGTDKAPVMGIDYAFYNDKGENIKYILVGAPHDTSAFAEKYDFNDQNVTIKVSGYRKVWDENIVADIYVGGGKLQIKLAPEISVIENSSRGVIDCGFSLSTQGMLERVGEDESAFPGLADPAALRALEWTTDVIGKDIIKIAKCDERQVTFTNLRKLLKNMGQRFQNNIPGYQLTLVDNFLKVLDDSQQRQWLIDHAQF